MPGWRFVRPAKPAHAPPANPLAIPPLGPVKKLFTGWPVVVSPFGPAYETGRAAYSNPPSAAVMQSVFPVVGQQDIVFGTHNWGYSYGLPVATTIFPLSGGNPPVGGFQVDQISNLGS